MASQLPRNQHRLFVGALVLIAIALAPIHCEPQGSNASLKQSTDGQQAVAGNGRQGRAIGGQGASANQLLSHHGTSSNTIEHNSSKSHFEAEKRQVQEFLTTKNIFKSIIKLLFGNQDEISATSRNVLGVLTKVRLFLDRRAAHYSSAETSATDQVDNNNNNYYMQVLDLLKNTFGQRSRSGTARTIRDSAEDAASAGVSMLQGYVKSVLATDDRCVQKYLCQASKEATRDSRDLGFIIASVGGYASSYLLDNSKSANFKSLYDASMKGRTASEDCARIYADCVEQ